MLEDISVSERRTRIRQLNSQERLADLAGDHLGDVFCQLKIKKSIPLGQVRDRGRDCEGAGDRGAADDCAEIFYRLNIIFRSGLVVRVAYIYAHIRFFHIY